MAALKTASIALAVVNGITGLIAAYDLAARDRSIERAYSGGGVEPSEPTRPLYRVRKWERTRYPHRSSEGGIGIRTGAAGSRFRVLADRGIRPSFTRWR